jgi:hypothetical protein
MLRRGERGVAGALDSTACVLRDSRHTSPLPSYETLWSSCYGCPDGTSNDWTRGSLTFISGHYAQDV